MKKFEEEVCKLNSCKTADEVLAVVPTVNSYLGMLVHYNTYELRRRVLLRLDHPIYKFIYIKGHYESIAIKKRYRKDYKMIQRIREEDRRKVTA